MTDKPEALRLADECDEGMVDFAEAAAELRRLSAWNARLTILAKQREELLEALKLARLMLIAHGETHAKIDEAIARAIERAITGEPK